MKTLSKRNKFSLKAFIIDREISFLFNANKLRINWNEIKWAILFT
ncbi:hypothetical protein HMPREF1608_03967 [Escherichia coli 908525]|nr:hypothetical protein HMPREF1595_04233 [Escherichia coli 907672]ESD66651.1 hypothetical protein HMPREF1608_03967 [Escherichia coli 908525]